MHRLALITTLALSAATAAFAQTPPPASAFGRLPAIQDADISPDGQRIVMLGGAPAKRTVTVATIDVAQLRILELGDVETFGVQWADDTHAILNVAYWDTVEVRSSYHLWRNVVIDRDAKWVTQLLHGSGPQTATTGQPVLGITNGPKATAMVMAPDWNIAVRDLNTRIFTAEDKAYLKEALWRVDLDTGTGRVEERAISNVIGWNVDKSGSARVREDVDPLTHAWRLYARPKGEGAWKLQVESPREEDEERYLGYSDAEDAIYLTDAGADGQPMIVRLGLADGSKNQIATDIAGAQLLWDKHLDKPVGVQSGFGPPQTRWLDPELQAIAAALTKPLGGPPGIEAWSKDRTRFLLRVTAPDYPSQWYLYDKARHELSPVGDEYPELKGVPLGKTSVISYKARDGLEIPAYLTLPPGASANQKLPLVLLPHGGPASYDRYSFDWWAQFIASRGYAVLQPEFRGSTGISKAFEDAGRKEWGGKMQTDLLDGIAYLARQGVIDPSRVCIVGASFGGYAALAGATLHSDAYRCAASINGVSDLPTMLGETMRQEGADSAGLRYWKQVMGDSIADGRLLEATSPAQQVTDATPPILMVVSNQDTTVNPAQSARMRDALEAAGRPVKYVTLENDDHYLMTSANRTKMLEAVGDFLAANLPVGR